MSESKIQDAKNDEIEKSSEKIKSQITDAEARESQRLKAEETINTLYRWKGPDRISTKKSNLYYAIVSVIFIIGIAIAVLTEELIFMVALIAVMALLYLADNIKPGLLKHAITNKGLQTGDKIYSWSIIEGFFVAEKDNRYQLVVDVNLDNVPNRLILPIGTGNPKKIVGLMSDYSRYLLQKEIGIDFINAFTIGNYIELSYWIEGESQPSENNPEIIE